MQTKQEKAIHAKMRGIKGYNVKLKRMEVIQNPQAKVLKNGRKAIVGHGSDGTPIYKFVKG